MKEEKNTKKNEIRKKQTKKGNKQKEQKNDEEKESRPFHLLNQLHYFVSKKGLPEDHGVIVQPHHLRC